MTIKWEENLVTVLITPIIPFTAYLQS